MYMWVKHTVSHHYIVSCGECWEEHVEREEEEGGEDRHIIIITIVVYIYIILMVFGIAALVC